MKNLVAIVSLILSLSISAHAEKCGHMDYVCINKYSLSQIKILEKEYAELQKSTRNLLTSIHHKRISRETQQDLIAVENSIEQIDQYVSYSRDKVNENYRALKKAKMFQGFRIHSALEDHIFVLEEAIEGLQSIHRNLNYANDRLTH